MAAAICPKLVSSSMFARVASLSVFAVVAATSSCFVFQIAPDGLIETPPVPVEIELSLLSREEGGDVVETSLDLDLAHPVASGRIADSLVVLSAEVEDRAHTGTMLVFLDPFGVAPPPPLRVEGVWSVESTGDNVGLRAVWGDIDDDGDDDVIAHCVHPFVIAILNDNGALRVVGPVRTDLSAQTAGALFDIDGDGDVEAVFADGGFDRKGAVYDVNGGITAVASDVTHFEIDGDDHCVAGWFTIRSEIWALASGCGNDDDPSPPLPRVVLVDDGAAIDSAILELARFSGLAGRGADDVDLFINGFVRREDFSEDHRAFAVRRDVSEATFDVVRLDALVDAVADFEGGGGVERVEVPDDVDLSLVLDDGDRERVLLVRGTGAQ